MPLGLCGIKTIIAIFTILKKSISILLLIVFAFNLGGYYAFFWAMKHTANMELAARLDADQYAEEEIVELKVPIDLPYPIFSTDFERVDGKFHHNGEIYKLVKQKLSEGTLHIICVKDKKEKQLSSDLKEFTKRSQDLPSNSAKHSGLHLSKLIKDYDQFRGTQLDVTEGWCQILQWTHISCKINSASADILSPPPKV